MKKFLTLLLILFLFSGTSEAAGKWRDGSTTFFDGDATLFNDVDTEIDEHMIDPLERYVIEGHHRMALIYSSASQITVSAGSVVCSNSGATLVEMRRNTSNTTVTWSDIDTGSEEGSQTYNLYANCDADATTATFKVSKSATSPSGVTLYKKLGTFYNNSSSNIDRTKIYAEPYGALWGDASGRGLITDIRDFGTSASSYTAKNSWDLKFAYGTLSVAGNSTGSISNLPFTSASTFSCSATFEATGSFDDGYAGCIPASGSGLTITNHQGSTRDMAWLAFGY